MSAGMTAQLVTDALANGDLASRLGVVGQPPGRLALLHRTRHQSAMRSAHGFRSPRRLHAYSSWLPV